MSCELAPITLYLPWRSQALPIAQRVAAWLSLAGQETRVQMLEPLPTPGAQDLALGDFTNGDAWVAAGGQCLDPLDWPGLVAYLQRHWLLSRLPQTRFAVTPAWAPLPGELWVTDGTGLDLALAPPEWALLQAAQQQGLLLATAESCTAGGIAARFAALPGSSAVLRQGYVVYSNAAKEEMLGVSPVTLRAHGAVSEAVVQEMLDGALRHADLAVAVSGIAGPGGAVPGKPVGTVCIGWALRDKRQVTTHCFAGDRWTVQVAAGTVALGGLLDLMRKEFGTIGLNEPLG